MSKNERIAALEIKCAELERRLSAFEQHVIKLLADAARAKAPPLPVEPWRGGDAPKIRDMTRNHWIQTPDDLQPLPHVRREGK
jgi:hypothetical protein